MPEHLTIELPTVTLRALTWEPTGSASGTAPLAVLLHGFPDTAHTWRHLGPALAADGWRVVAPFTRGYAPSSAATDDCYHVAALVGDAIALHDALDGGSDAVLIGHDWGAITAIAVAAHPRNPYSRAISMAVPPLGALRQAAVLRVLPAQVRNSWYIGFNQIPGLAERSMERLIRHLWRTWSPGYDASEDLPAVLASIGSAPHDRAALGYYRALGRPARSVPSWCREYVGSEHRQPLVPLLTLHGDRDGCLDPRLARVAARNLPPASVRILPNAGHFLHLERPDAVATVVRSFLRESAPA